MQVWRNIGHQAYLHCVFHEGREVSSDPAMPNRGSEGVDGAEVDNGFSKSGTL